MKQAIIVIHGIGEQRPLATIRQFTAAITDHHAWSKPDRMSESFELRRFAIGETSSMPTTDVYELYWAHHMGRARWTAVLGWMRRLLMRRKSSLPAGLHSMYCALWTGMFLALLGPLIVALSIVKTRTGWMQFFDSVLTYTPVVAFAAQLVLGRIVLGYIGDAARYLTPDPENIEARSKIRAEGVKLLRHLHSSKRYSRILVVGHSLGSVIGYDVLRHLWDELRQPSFEEEKQQPEAKAFEAEIERVTKPPAGTTRGAAVQRFQEAQHRLWREQRSLRTPWLVTDFVTLGSPLAHGALLLEDTLVSLDERKMERELPTCPPTSGNEEAHYKETRDISAGESRSKWTFRVPHHAAVFASTRWTNLYFPHCWLVLGDIVGGPLADVFGAGIRDVPVRPSAPGWRARTLASHVLYWKQRPKGLTSEDRTARKQLDKATGTKDAIVALRSSLQLESKLSVEPWPDP